MILKYQGFYRYRGQILSLWQKLNSFTHIYTIIVQTELEIVVLVGYPVKPIILARLNLISSRQFLKTS